VTSLNAKSSKAIREKGRANARTTCIAKVNEPEALKGWRIGTKLK
jgi:hypothetical protein